MLALTPPPLPGPLGTLPRCLQRLAEGAKQIADYGNAFQQDFTTLVHVVNNSKVGQGTQSTRTGSAYFLAHAYIKMPGHVLIQDMGTSVGCGHCHHSRMIMCVLVHCVSCFTTNSHARCALTPVVDGTACRHHRRRFRCHRERLQDF
jgi:hypothetical protein